MLHAAIYRAPFGSVIVAETGFLNYTLNAASSNAIIEDFPALTA